MIAKDHLAKLNNGAPTQSHYLRGKHQCPEASEISRFRQLTEALGEKEGFRPFELQHENTENIVSDLNPAATSDSRVQTPDLNENLLSLMQPVLQQPSLVTPLIEEASVDTALPVLEPSPNQGLKEENLPGLLNASNMDQQNFAPPQNLRQTKAIATSPRAPFIPPWPALHQQGTQFAKRLDIASDEVNQRHVQSELNLGPLSVQSPVPNRGNPAAIILPVSSKPLPETVLNVPTKAGFDPGIIPQLMLPPFSISNGAQYFASMDLSSLPHVTHVQIDQIKRNALGVLTNLELVLEPAELGRISARLQHEDGRLTLILNATHRHVAEDLVRDSSLLLRALGNQIPGVDLVTVIVDNNAIARSNGEPAMVADFGTRNQNQKNQGQHLAATSSGMPEPLGDTIAETDSATLSRIFV